MRFSLRKSELLRIFLFAIFLGIFWGRSFFLFNQILFCGVLCFTLSFIFRNWVLGVVAVFLFGNLWGQVQHHRVFKSVLIDSFYGETVEITGMVKSFPSINIETKSVKVDVQKLKIKEKIFESKELGGVLLKMPVEMEIDYGDEVFVVGTLKQPRNFGDFDYQKFLKRNGMSSILSNLENIKVLQKGVGGNFFMRQAKKLRNAFSQNLQAVLPSEHAQIAEGILLGVKSKLPKAIEQNFKNSGIQHILVVSGFNVTVLLVFVAFFLNRFGGRVVFVGSVFFLLFFVLMVGLEPSILRAAIFGTLSSLAVLWGKTADSRNFLFFSATLLGIYSPTMIQYDVGFFLSFSATMGIILGVPIMEKLPLNEKIKTPIAVIISAQIAVLPILGLYFQQFPFIGFVSNFFVEPFVPIAMGFSFLVGLTGFISETGAFLFALPAKIVIDGIFLIAKVFGAYAPLSFPSLFSVVFAVLVWSFFLWGSFSRYFQQKFLEK